MDGPMLLALIPDDLDRLGFTPPHRDALLLALNQLKMDSGFYARAEAQRQSAQMAREAEEHQRRSAAAAAAARWDYERWAQRTGGVLLELAAKGPGAAWVKPLANAMLLCVEAAAKAVYHVRGIGSAFFSIFYIHDATQPKRCAFG